MASEIEGYLAGIRAFYRFLHGHQLISLKFLQAIEAECGQQVRPLTVADTPWEYGG